MSNIFITAIDGQNDFDVPTDDTELDTATTELDTLLSGVANLSYSRVLAWVEDSGGPGGAEGVRSLNCLIEQFTYSSEECPSEAEVDTLTTAIESALEGDPDIDTIGTQYVHIFASANSLYFWDKTGTVIHPKTLSDDVAVGSSTIYSAERLYIQSDDSASAQEAVVARLVKDAVSTEGNWEGFLARVDHTSSSLGPSYRHFVAEQNFSPSSASTLTESVGFRSDVTLGDDGTITDHYAFYAATPSSDNGTMTTYYGLYVNSSVEEGWSPINAYGVYIDDVTADTSYGIYQADGGSDNYFAGPVAVGTDSTPGTSEGIVLTSTTKAVRVSNMTNTQLGNLTATSGMIVFQTDGTSGFYGYDGASWNQLDASAGATYWDRSTTTFNRVYPSTILDRVVVGTDQASIVGYGDFPGMINFYTAASVDVGYAGYIVNDSAVNCYGAYLTVDSDTNGTANGYRVDITGTDTSYSFRSEVTKGGSGSNPVYHFYADLDLETDSYVNSYYGVYIGNSSGTTVAVQNAWAMYINSMTVDSRGDTTSNFNGIDIRPQNNCYDFFGFQIQSQTTARDYWGIRIYGGSITRNAYGLRIDALGGGGLSNFAIYQAGADDDNYFAGDLILVEKADHSSTPTAARGIIWVKNDTPNTLWFTDDAGTDHQLGTGGSSEWTDAGTYLYPSEATDGVRIGASADPSPAQLQVTNPTDSGTFSYAGVFGLAKSGSGTITAGYGINILSPSGSGTITDCIGLAIAAQTTGPTATGYGVYQSGASDLNYFAGQVGVGTSSPGSYRLNVQDARFGGYFDVVAEDTSSPAVALGTSISSATYAVNDMRQINIASPGGSGTIASAYGIYISSQNESHVTDGWGIYQLGTTDGNYFAGNLKVGGSDSVSVHTAIAAEASVRTFEATISTTSSETLSIGYDLQVTPNATHTITTVYGFNIDAIAGAGSVTNYYGVRLEGSGSLRPTNTAYGIYVGDLDASNTTYAVYTTSSVNDGVSYGAYHDYSATSLAFSSTPSFYGTRIDVDMSSCTGTFDDLYGTYFTLDTSGNSNAYGDIYGALYETTVNNCTSTMNLLRGVVSDISFTSIPAGGMTVGSIYGIVSDVDVSEANLSVSNDVYGARFNVNASGAAIGGTSAVLSLAGTNTDYIIRSLSDIPSCLQGDLAIGQATATSELDVSGDIELSGAFYLGDPTTDGSWRLQRSGNNLVYQRRESSSWVTKQTISA